MTTFTTSNIAFACGILGNIVSFLVYLAPVPTFHRICKKKSTEGFQSFPYAVALFSAMLYLYYAFLKKHAIILVTINSVGFVIEVVYLTIYMIFATKESRVLTSKLILILNISSLGFITGGTYFLSHGHERVSIVGWFCAVFSVCVSAAPFTIVRQVIRTKSVEFMPFPLSFFITISSVVWFFYGFLIRDYYIATPNIMGFTFGMTQMILYMVYKNKKTSIKQQIQQGEAKVHDISHHETEIDEHTIVTIEIA